MGLTIDPSMQFYITKNMGYCLKLYQNGLSHIKVKKKYQEQCSTIGYSSVSQKRQKKREGKKRQKSQTKREKDRKRDRKARQELESSFATHINTHFKWRIWRLIREMGSLETMFPQDLCLQRSLTCLWSSVSVPKTEILLFFKNFCPNKRTKDLKFLASWSPQGSICVCEQEAFRRSQAQIFQEPCSNEEWHVCALGYIGLGVSETWPASARDREAGCVLSGLIDRSSVWERTNWRAGYGEKKLC